MGRWIPKVSLSLVVFAATRYEATSASTCAGGQKCLNYPDSTHDRPRESRTEATTLTWVRCIKKLLERREVNVVSVIHVTVRR